ncbi:type II secretion system F family protein [Neptuniibacter caesariensis]|uniref:General secretion pathway protein F n=1 Tax=Neptuniibacter caesariensis TaxID=207954 RepID=A0A7U8GSA7_NEPCE|nr:type II secretion system F family protein [Neptuniibacter caesariensis]EAR61211.1 general secretion pathway protein F [Oceanospirillum sp. MED92] [Neptuniibacter caesariensis]
MAVFSYKGRNRDGAEVSGQVEAATAAMAATQLSTDGVIPINIEEVIAKAESAGSKEIQIKLFQKISLDELIMFSRQMYSLTKAGVPITRAMRGLANTVQNPLLVETLSDLANDLEKGHELSSALAKHPKVFSELYVSMIHVGENTGQLDDAFRQMASYLELERQTVKQVKQATRYPMFVMIAIAAAITLINIVVIPQFKNIFVSFGGEMPLPTKILVSISDFMVNWWYLLLGGLLLALVSFYRWKKSSSGRMVWDRRKLKFPIIGPIIYRTILARFSRTFSIVLKAGVPIEQGLAIVANAVGNKHIGTKVASMRQGIERGESFTQTAHQTEMFSPLVMQMLAVGEETGRVDQMLEEAAGFYEQEVEYDLKNLTSAIEPILIVAIGIMVLILALGVFLPLWELNETIN